MNIDAVAYELARRMYDRYMNGSNNYHNNTGVDGAALVLGISEQTLREEVTKKFNELRTR